MANTNRQWRREISLKASKNVFFEERDRKNKEQVREGKERNREKEKKKREEKMRERENISESVECYAPT